MRVLAIDTATPAITVGIASIEPDGYRVLAERVIVNARAHGELLTPLINEALTEAGLSPSDLQAIVAGVGPGPYTGLRVGLVTAQAMGQALGVPTYGVCTLDAFAVGHLGEILVATDARRKEVYWGAYLDGVRVSGPAVDRPADVAVSATQALGDGAVQYAEDLKVPVGEPQFPPMAGLIALAVDRIRAQAPGEPLTPLYLRRPDAVAKS